LFGLLAWAIALRAPPEQDPALRSMRIGAQGGLVVLLLSSVTFPSFNSITITAVMGVLIAICFMPVSRRTNRPASPELGREPSGAKPKRRSLRAVARPSGSSDAFDLGRFTRATSHPRRLPGPGR